MFKVGDKVIVNNFSYIDEEDLEDIMEFINNNPLDYFVVTSTDGLDGYIYELSYLNGDRVDFMYFAENEMRIYEE